MNAAPLVEIFSSIQGEGSLMGRPMGFVRVAGCPLRCTYCDTPASHAAGSRFDLRLAQGSVAHDNPATSARAAELLAQSVAASPYRDVEWVSVTGGEPLLYPDFVAELGVALHRQGRRVLLETAALDAAALQTVLPQLDHLSADYKLPGTLARPAKGDPGAGCVACVDLALARGVDVDVKIVLTAAVSQQELAQALRRLSPARGRFTLVLQPVTATGAEAYPCPPQHLGELCGTAIEAGFAPLVLPQAHRLLGLD